MNKELKKIVDLCDELDVTVLSISMYDRAVLIQSNDGTPTVISFKEIYKATAEQKGFICPHCQEKIAFANARVKRWEQYEGLDVGMFDCPSCETEISDLECEIWEEERSEVWEDAQYGVVNTEFLLTDLFNGETMTDVVVPEGAKVEVLWSQKDSYMKSGYALLVKFVDNGIDKLDGHTFNICSSLISEE